jgi:hypothetical protein
LPRLSESQLITATLTALKLLQQRPKRRADLALHIQENLITLISRAEQSISRRKQKIAFMRKAFARRGLGKIEAKAAKDRIAAHYDSIDQSKSIIGLCRDIGDSIAFLYIDRWDIKPLFLKEAAGNITGKRGNRLERAIFRRLFKEGYTCLLNDLTGSLRFADVTVFGPYGTFRLIEAKSGNGGNKKRAARQQAQAEAVMDYLVTDKREFEGAPMIRRSLEERPRYHLGHLNRLLETYFSTGRRQAFREVEPGVFYMVLGEEPSGSLPTRLSKSEGPIMVMFSNDFKRRGVAYYPFPLIFNKIEHIANFYAGEFSIGVVVDLNKVMRLSGVSGKIEQSDDPQMPFTYYPERGGQDGIPEFMHIGWHITNRMAAEFLSPRSFVRMLAQRIELIASDAGLREEIGLP